MKLSIIAAGMLLAAPLTMWAEGYQINTLSAKQQGMGHTGVALKLGTESQFFNPAGLGFMDRTLDVSGSITGIAATAKATVDGQKYTTDNSISTPIFFSAAFNIYDNFKAGISFYTPYGSGINWGKNWPGSVLSQNVNLKVYTIQPTFAYRILRNLSVGVGITLSWGSVDLSKGLVTPETTDQLLGLYALSGASAAMGIDPTYRFGSTTPASVRLRGTSQLAVGLNVGAMFDINSKWTIGAQFRTHTEMKVKSGDASLSFANNTARTLLESKLKVIDQANFKSKMPCPYVFAFGVAYKPLGNLTIAADAQLTGWKTYKQLNIEFLDEQVAAYNQHIEKNYSNSWAVKVGAEYGITKRFDIRAGIMIDTTPVNDKFYNPETPGMTKINPSVGLSFRPINGLSFDLAFVYVAGLGRDNASCTYPDLLAGQINQVAPQLNLPLTKTFTADYNVHAFVPSFGISYSF